MTTDLTYTNSGFIFFPRRSPEAVISGLYDILTSYQACRFPLAFCITVVSTQFNPKISKMAAGVIAITSTFQAGKGRSERKKRACMQGLSALLSPLRVFLKVRLIPTYNLFSSVQFSHSVVSDSLLPHGLQHARVPCPSPTPRPYSNSCPWSQ